MAVLLLKTPARIYFKAVALMLSLLPTLYLILREEIVLRLWFTSRFEEKALDILASRMEPFRTIVTDHY